MTDELIALLKEANAVTYWVPPGTSEEARKQISRWAYAWRDEHARADAQETRANAL
jgi:hypothetical protein